MFTMEEQLLGKLVGERALTMIHGICLPSYDTIFPLSAESAQSCTIMGFVSLRLANNNLRNPMNKFVQDVWIHTLWTVQTFNTEAQPTRAHSCSVTCSKHSQITNRKPAAPINQILSRANLPKNSAVRRATGWCHCVQGKTNDRKKRVAPP